MTSRRSARIDAQVQKGKSGLKDHLNHLLPNELLTEVFEYTRQGTSREEQTQRMIEMGVCRRWNGMSVRRAVAIDTVEEMDRLVTSLQSDGRGDQIVKMEVHLERGNGDKGESTIALLSLCPKVVSLKLRGEDVAVALGQFNLGQTDSRRRLVRALESLRCLESIELLGGFSDMHPDLIA